MIDEVSSNLSDFSAKAVAAWPDLSSKLQFVRDVLTFPWISASLAAKDRPILFTAAAWSDVLLTLDRRDFQNFFGNAFYHLRILKPGEFLHQQRTAGKLA